MTDQAQVKIEETEDLEDLDKDLYRLNEELGSLKRMDYDEISFKTVITQVWHLLGVEIFRWIKGKAPLQNKRPAQTDPGW